LNCGNRLLPATPSPQQVQPVGDATLAAPEDWGTAGPSSSNGSGWGESASSPSATSAPEQPTLREPSAAPVAQATLDKLQEPGRFILRSDSGEALQEYPLDKPEIVIGRAPNSDILLSKDKLTSRRHATVFYENGQYMLRDERSANGTFVNGQQLDEGASHLLKDGDQVGIGEHELIYRAFGSTASDVENFPTMSVQYANQPDVTYRTRDDSLATVTSQDDYGTDYALDSNNMNAEPSAQAEERSVAPEQAEVASSVNASVSNPSTPSMSTSSSEGAEPVYEPVTHDVTAIDNSSSPAASTSSSIPERVVAAQPVINTPDGAVTFNRFASISSPSLPDISPLMAALSTLDGQIMSLQEQFNATQEAMRSHDGEVSQTANQLRTGIRRVSERMDNMIADVARSREALAWAELLQLMEDVMNNPRDIEYVTKLARKARELNKVFQIHQTVLNTMAECNSLLRSMIGEEK
jgi:pSer/pThr/pTyr-binding forkhead associated (FHA) protein